MSNQVVRKSFQRFFPLLGGYYLIILLETAGSGALPLVFGMSVQTAFSQTTQNGIDFKGFKLLLVLLVVLGALQLAKQVLEQFHHKCASSYWISRTVEKTGRMQLATIQAMGAGNINQRSVDEIDSITDYATSKLSAVVSSFLLMAVAVFMLFRLMPVFTLALLLILLLGVPIGLKLMNYGRRLLKNASEVWARFSALTTDNAASQIQLRALGATGRMNHYILESLETVLAIGMSAMLKVVALLIGFMLMTLGMVYLSVLYIEHMNLFSGLSPAVVISFLGYLFLLVMRAGAVSGTIGSLQGARAKIERLDEFLALPESTSQAFGAHGHFESLSVRGLCAQVDGRPIFEGFDLQMNPGDIVLVKGPSGCGKSTLLRSLAGLQDSSAGLIAVDGLEVDHLGGIDGCAVYLPQEIRFFEGSLLWNIELLSGSSVDIGKVDLLLGQYRLQNRLQVSDGPSSCLQEAGANLSGGEKQRLALAIVELMGRRVVLLDEPTSQVDPVSEKIILEAISNLARQGSMIIMAAHREATEDIAQRVIDFTEFSRVCGDRQADCMSPA